MSAKLGSCERFLEDCNEEGSQDHEDLVHTLHIQLQQHGGHCTIAPFRYKGGNTHQLMHTHTEPPFHRHTPHKITNALMSVSTVYQDISRCLMRDLAKFANFHFREKFSLKRDKTVLNKIANF